MVTFPIREPITYEVVTVLKEADKQPDDVASERLVNGREEGDSECAPLYMSIPDLRILGVSPTIMNDSGEPVWKLSLQFPWNDQPELHYMPIKEGSPAPKVGTCGAKLQRGEYKKNATGNEDKHFAWNLISLDLPERPEPKTMETPEIAKSQVAGAAQSDNSQREHDVQEESYQEQLAQPQIFSEHDAEQRAFVALKSSTEMVSGYLASSGQLKKDYTWKDMVEIATTIADAFLLWIDDATQSQMEQHSAEQPDMRGNQLTQGYEKDYPRTIHPNGTS